MLRQNYDFSSVHIAIPEPLENEILDWGMRIPDKNIFMYEGTLGREDEIHITVLYGIYSASSQQTRELVKKEKPLKVSLGKLQVFTSDTRFDVVYIEAECERLYELNKKLRSHISYTNRYPEYEPHVTIAYVKKGRGWEYLGGLDFQGKEFECDNLVFSSKNGDKESIPLQK